MGLPRFFSAADIRAALPMRAAIDAMRSAFGALATGRVTLPARSTLRASANATLLIMPGQTEHPATLGAKLVSIFPGNDALGAPVVQALVVMFDPATGTPNAILDGTALTAIRTGAASGLATDLLARADAETVAILGAGVQARTQLEAVRCVRPVQSVRIWSRTRARADEFAAEVLRHDMTLPRVSVANSASDAARGADIICCATPATTPFLFARDVGPGTHINAVGSFTPAMCEFEPTLLASAFVVVDQREAALSEAGEVIAAIAQRLIEPGQLVELGAIVNGTARARTAREETTLFKSVGLAVQDLVAADRVRGFAGVSASPGNQ